MKFFIVMFNGGFNEAACAARLGLQLRKSGHFGGWVTREQIDELDKGNFRYVVKY